MKVTPSGSEEGVIDIDLDMSVEALGATNEIDADASVRYSCTTVGGQSELRMVDAGSGVQLYVNPAISFLATSLAMLLEDAIVAVLGAHMAVPGFGLEGLAGWIDIGLDHAILTAGIAIMFGISHDIDRDDITTALPFCPDISLTEDAIELHWADSDFDLVPDALDNCPYNSDMTFADSDGDEVGNACDNCLYYWNKDQQDEDGDEVGDMCDNCPAHPNPSQQDCDSDWIGDACDPTPDIPPSPVAVWPSEVVFGFGLPGETERQYAVVTNTGAQGFSILDALTLDLGDRVSIDLGPANPCVGGACYEPCGPPGSRVLNSGESCGLGLTYHYAADFGHGTGRLRVFSDIAAACVGHYYAEADVESHGVSTLMFEPVAIDFGEVAIGSRSKYRSLLLRNVGGTDITFVASSTDPVRFELTSAPISGCQLIDTLHPGESCSFRVTFTPSGQGLVLGRLVIESDVYAHQDTVRLVGRGI